MPAPKPVLELVDKFNANEEDYRSPEYKEAQLRQEFINPLFECLGWDMANTLAHAEAYKDVVHEDTIKIGTTMKAPDYSFRVGGVRKFFLEAKKPSVGVKNDSGPAYQLRRYAWSAKLPLSVLTNFAEFAVYECRKKPDQHDKAATGRIHYFRHTEYAEKWDEIAGIFSKDAVLKGSFDRFADAGKRRGTATVDSEFLKQIEEWRAELARNIALRNKKLSEREVNTAVQLTLDRIIFLRICEDRGIEHYAELQRLLDHDDVYEEYLVPMFVRADAKYNSGLFYFDQEGGRDEPDTLTPSLKIDDKVLKGIIKGLYFPESPYEFSVISADILGQVYEQFLGKVIRLTAGHQAKVEEKPEVRKAGGVYYTPTYIVQYIVEQTVGKLLGEPEALATGIPTKQARKLRVLDPACGSGSFLLGAYQYLLDWHRDRYVAEGPENHPKELAALPAGGYRLTTTEKKRILTTNIYGVDIDPQAVEVTKLSLLLKVLEGETQKSLELVSKERALPDLDANIRCGNSLISGDYYDDRLDLMSDEEEVLRINAFDWQTAFPTVMKAGGFDAVIGNPPYIRMEEFKDLKSYLRSRYKTHDERSDLYVYFLERAHELLRPGGAYGMIVSNKFIRANYGRKVRELLEGIAVEQIVDFAGLPVFRGATVRTVILLTSRAKRTGATWYSPPPRATFESIEDGHLTVRGMVQASGYWVAAEALTADNWFLAPAEVRALIANLTQRGSPLVEVVNGKICMGIKSGLTEAFVIDGTTRKAIVAKNPEAAAIIRPFIQGRDIGRYHLDPPGDYLIYTHHGIDMKPYPAVLEHLKPFKQQLLNRATEQEWYELQQPQYAYVGYLEKPKIVFPDMAISCRFTLDTRGHFGANTVYFLPTDDRFLLGLLNSRVAQFYFSQTCAALEGAGEAYLRFFGQYLEAFPVCAAPSEAVRDQLVSLVEKMVLLHAQLAAAKAGQVRDTIQSQIDATDAEIDRIVYDLYGLTADEIRVVEGAVAGAPAAPASTAEDEDG